VNIKIRVCQIIGLAPAGSAGPVPTALPQSRRTLLSLHVITKGQGRDPTNLWTLFCAN